MLQAPLRVGNGNIASRKMDANFIFPRCHIVRPRFQWDGSVINLPATVCRTKNRTPVKFGIWGRLWALMTMNKPVVFPFGFGGWARSLICLLLATSR